MIAPTTYAASSFVFAGPQVNMNLNAGEAVFVSASAGLGTILPGTKFAYEVGYQVGAGAVDIVTGAPSFAMGIPPNQEIAYAASYIFTAPSTGNYNIGFIVDNFGLVPLNDNNDNTVSVIVLS